MNSLSRHNTTYIDILVIPCANSCWELGKSLAIERTLLLWANFLRGLAASRRNDRLGMQSQGHDEEGEDRRKKLDVVGGEHRCIAGVAWNLDQDLYKGFATR